MQPTPETLEALKVLEDQGDYTVALTLDAFAVRAGEIVPDLVGMSFAMLDPDLTFTMTNERFAKTREDHSPIGSSLKLPLTHADTLVGGISLYAESPTSFVGRHDALAEVLGADASAAVSNEDLDFWSRLQSGSAARQIQELDVIDQAIGFIASARDTELDVADKLLREAADQAGISEAATAQAVLQRQLDIPQRGTPQV